MVDQNEAARNPPYNGFAGVAGVAVEDFLPLIHWFDTLFEVRGWLTRTKL